MSDYQIFKRDTDLAVEKIRTGAMTMAQGAIELGYQLKVARDTGVLAGSGYNTMSEFARAEYGIRPDETTRYMQLNDTYSENGYSRRLMDKYTGIGKSILTEMLYLPDLVREEITPSFSREDVRTLKGEVEEENKVTDLEVMMEDTDETQEELSSILEKTVYQLGKDNPEIYTRLFEALREGSTWKVAEILAPNEERIYSLRIPGTGRMILSLKVTEQEVKIINVRTQEKENYTWQQLEEAFRKLMDFSIAPEESWEKRYGENFPEKHQEEPKESKPEKKPPKVQKASKPEKKDTKPEKSQETDQEEQIPGQDNILNHEEYMPQPIPGPEKPETQKEPEPQENTELLKHPETTIIEPVPIPEKTEEPKEDVPPENTPSAGIAPAQHEVVEKTKRRKEYLDSLTEYGAADYLASAVRGFRNITFGQMTTTNFWLDWMDGLVDHNGRPWVD